MKIDIEAKGYWSRLTALLYAYPLGSAGSLTEYVVRDRLSTIYKTHKLISTTIACKNVPKVKLIARIAFTGK